MKKAIVFDLGNTLVGYYGRSESLSIIRQCITEVERFLTGKDLLMVSEDDMWQRFKVENYEARDYHVRPLYERLSRIFHFPDTDIGEITKTDICRTFLKPIFDRAHIYNDVLPTLRQLKLQRYKIGIISNAPWGSPGMLWHEEIERHGLGEYVDVIVFCADIGWRKPAKGIFEFTLKKLGVTASECVFIGDDPRWDVVGPRSVGMDSIVIDRSGTLKEYEGNRISSLIEIWNGLEKLDKEPKSDRDNDNPKEDETIS